MDNLKHSASLPTHLSLTKSPSSTGSFQSHLSTTNSQQRLRAINSYAFSSNPKQTRSLRHPLDPELNDAHVLSQSSRLASFIHAFFPAAVSHTAGPHSLRVRSWSSLALKWAACVYCCLSIVFLSVAIYKHIRDDDLALKEKEPFYSSPLTALSTHQRLSRILSAYPQPLDFEPCLVHKKVDATAVTVCLWSRDTEIDLLPAWASRWPGPISLLLTTTITRPSPMYDELLEKLQAGLSPVSLSVHLIFVKPQTEPSPNMYLNIARLFAPTPRVVLFPSNLSVLPPPNVYPPILAHSLSDPRPPAILTSSKQASWPYPSLAAVVLRRDHPFWCTERFFFSSSRGANWEECLWQLSLETFGEMKSIQIPGWKHGELIPSALPVSRAIDTFASLDLLSTQNKVQRRLSSKYRSESCDLSAKRLAALEAEGSDRRPGKRTSQWLKKFCRQALEVAQIDYRIV